MDHKKVGNRKIAKPNMATKKILKTKVVNLS